MKTIPVPDFDLIVFGATGDLSKRKLIPALYYRMVAGQIPPGSRIIGSSRREMDKSSFRLFAKQALEEFVRPDKLNTKHLQSFLEILDFVRMDASSDVGWEQLAEMLEGIRDRVRAFYLSISPSLFGPVLERLVKHGFALEPTRVVVEKPFGRDFASAQALNRLLSNGFGESQIYRIDHYLGKETVQNLMALRFANSLFEPLWNSRHVDHVQITVAEDIGVEGRGGYYNQSGAMRDMVQNHMMQLLCLTAMEPPNMFEADAVRDEKLKVIKALEPITLENIAARTVRGQYRANGEAKSYFEDVGDSDSRTECYLALKVEIANWRWSGTPFYLRTGKRLRSRLTEIVVIFKDTPHSIFGEKGSNLHGNALVMRLQPDEAITLQMNIKDPGPGGMRLREVSLDMSFKDQLNLDGAEMPDAYERLLMDVIRGDQTLFMRGDEVEAAWKWADSILQAWSKSGHPPRQYDAGSSGPEDAMMLIHQDGRRWRDIQL